ncbi:MAG: Uncharacterised protein [Flavobacteriia bacterium]|nr:MAG: Uncharacterised protein [Flavobacteriia bacterium]
MVHPFVQCHSVQKDIFVFDVFKGIKGNPHGRGRSLGVQVLLFFKAQCIGGVFLQILRRENKVSKTIGVFNDARSIAAVESNGHLWNGSSVLGIRHRSCDLEKQRNFVNAVNVIGTHPLFGAVGSDVSAMRATGLENDPKIICRRIDGILHILHFSLRHPIFIQSNAENIQSTHAHVSI